jgi:predicted anti-sigma-YlaC factor YlaD
MTGSLRCREAERLTLESEDRDLPETKRSLVEAHLRGCRSCRDFAAERTLIRRELAAIRWPAPSDELVFRTRRLIRMRPPEAATAALPVWIIVALAVVSAVTAVGLAIAMADVTPNMTLADLPVGALAAVITIAQNALMLLFAPVVLRTFRARRGAAEDAR